MIKTNRIPFGEYGLLVYIVFFEGLMPGFQREDSPFGIPVLYALISKLPVVAECINSVSKLAHIGIRSAVRSFDKLCQSL